MLKWGLKIRSFLIITALIMGFAAFYLEDLTEKSMNFSSIRSDFSLEYKNSISPKPVIKSDLLDYILSGKANKTTKIKVISNDKTAYFKALNIFRDYGGTIIKSWKSINVFLGEIDTSMIIPFSKKVSSLVKIIEPGYYKAKPLLDVSTKIIRAVPIVWEKYGYRGDPNSAIAVIDTGIDDSHPMLSTYSDLDFSDPNVKIVGWYDPTSGTTEPVDYGGHGSHVGSIAAGREYNDDPDADGYFETFFVIDNYYLASGYYPIPVGIFVNFTGVLRVNVTWSGTAGITISSVKLYDPNGFSRASDSTEPFVLSYNITSDNLLGYWRAVINVDANQDGYLDLKVEFEKQFDDSEIFSGVAPDVKIVGVRGLDGDLSDLIDAILWVADNAETYHIIACVNSWVIVDNNGNPTRDISVEQAMMEVIKKGVIVVAAAGNSGDTAPEGQQIGTPANMDHVITVAATNEKFQLTDYSSRGPAIDGNITKPDISAPGGVLEEGLISAADTNDHEDFGTEFENDLIMYQGTSMAAPHVAGVAMLLAEALGGYNSWDYNPTSLRDSKSFLVKMVMLMTAWETYIVNGWVDRYEGFGFVQADAAIEALTMEYNLGSVETGELTWKANRFSKHVWARKVYLTAGESYDFYLYNPSSTNFDLYLYYPTPDEYGRPRLAAWSNSTILGNAEHINFSANETGYYYIVIKAITGSGKFVFSSYPLNNVYPSVSITSPTSPYYTNNSTVVITWNATDEYGIDFIEIYRNDTKVFSTSSLEIENYTMSLPSDGVWNITIIAVNIIGNSARDSTFVYLDRTAPSIIIITPLNGSNVSVGDNVIKWNVSDETGIRKILIKIDDGEWVDVTGESSYNTSLSGGEHTIYIYVEDLAGNGVNITIVVNAISEEEEEEPGAGGWPLSGPPPISNTWKLIITIAIVVIFLAIIILPRVLKKRK